MKRSFSIFKFMLTLMALTFAGGLLMYTIDGAFDLGGELVQFWPAIPVVKVVMQFLPDRYAITLDESVLSDAAIKTLFARTVEEQLFPKNEFFLKSVDDAQFVVESDTGAKVVYPIAGTNPNTEKDRAILPAPITKRTDDSNEYDLSEFTTDPTLIGHTESLIVNYSKRASVLRNHVETLNTRIADHFAGIWLPDGATNIVRTSGDNRTAGAPSATGTRKKVTETDIISIAEVMDRMSVPHEGRFCLLPADMMADLRGVDNFKRQDAYGNSNIPDGVIARIHGFWVMSREYVGVYDNTGTPVKKAYGAAGAATDHMAGLFWNDKFVTRAKSGVKSFIDEDKPEYYGSIFSFLVRAGGKIRKDKKGVVALVQTTGV